MLEVRKAAGAPGAFASRVSLADVARDSAVSERLGTLAPEYRVAVTGGRRR